MIIYERQSRKLKINYFRYCVGKTVCSIWLNSHIFQTRDEANSAKKRKINSAIPAKPEIKFMSHTAQTLYVRTLYANRFRNIKGKEYLVQNWINLLEVINWKMAVDFTSVDQRCVLPYRSTLFIFHALIICKYHRKCQYEKKTSSLI